MVFLTLFAPYLPCEMIIALGMTTIDPCLAPYAVLTLGCATGSLGLGKLSKPVHR